MKKRRRNRNMKVVYLTSMENLLNGEHDDGNDAFSSKADYKHIRDKTDANVECGMARKVWNNVNRNEFSKQSNVKIV